VEEMHCIKYLWFDGDSWNATLLDTTITWADVDIVVDRWGQSHVCWDGNGRQNYAKGYGFLGVAEKDEKRKTRDERLQISPNPFTHNAVVEFRVRGSQPEADEPLAQEFVGVETRHGND
jgi:hypothetical protein